MKDKLRKQNDGAAQAKQGAKCSMGVTPPLAPGSHGIKTSGEKGKGFLWKPITSYLMFFSYCKNLYEYTRFSGDIGGSDRGNSLMLRTHSCGSE